MQSVQSSFTIARLTPQISTLTRTEGDSASHLELHCSGASGGRVYIRMQDDVS